MIKIVNKVTMQDLRDSSIAEDKEFELYPIDFRKVPAGRRFTCNIYDDFCDSEEPRASRK